MKRILIQAPIGSRAGYGDHARDIALSLINAEKYDVKLINVNWGGTPANALTKDNPNHVKLLEHITTPDQVKERPDLFIQVSVPSEFTPIGTKNLGITAGIETTICPPEWLEGLNKMDKNIVPSEFSRMVIQQTTFEKKDQNTDAVIGQLKLEKPMEVIFEGLDTTIYNKKAKAETIDLVLQKIPESFAFLSVGHWLPGDIGQDRKDLGMIVKTFLNTFKNKKTQPALILKTSGATFSVVDRDDILAKIESIKKSIDSTNLPNVYLLHGDLTENEMASLYAHPKVKAMVTYTKGEGFGRPLLEFSSVGKPIIAPNWSGHVDFLPKDKVDFILGTLTPIHESAIWDKKVFLENSTWFTVNYQAGSDKMADIFKNYKQHKTKAAGLNHHSKTNFNMAKMDKLIVDSVDELLADVPSVNDFIMPPDLGEITLPTLEN